MSDEEFVDVVFSQLPIMYQRQQAISTNAARESDRARQTPMQLLFPQCNARENHHNTPCPGQNTTWRGNFRVNAVQWQAGQQPRNYYSGRGSYRQRWNGGRLNRNSYCYNPGYSERRQSSLSYGNQGGSYFHPYRQDKRRNVGTGK
ncbi:hypothetical protein PR048_016435 [Dryococelus australis]|uniref:Uncharacterized protein n=1 Tax=Dryococelus australis TaxID=614101 RepID=A0ABQ9HJP9_9NEOP|nr:hypothetical protein PR048_016435 [Dryococelus australis]